jgi:aconitase A
MILTDASSALNTTAGNPDFYPSPNPKPQPDTEIVISPTSSRLEVLEPFNSHFSGEGPHELPPMKCLLRVRGKCTTDHISAAVSLLIPCLMQILIVRRAHG